MPVKLSTTLDNIDKKITNPANREIILGLHEHLRSSETSENYQNGVIKAVLNFCEYVGSDKPLIEVKDKELILNFLESNRKTMDSDPEQKWITTWNDYLWRIKFFFRWLYNLIQGKNNNLDEWITPELVNIKKKKTKFASSLSTVANLRNTTYLLVLNDIF